MGAAGLERRGWRMNRGRPDFMARVPTLTEEVEPGSERAAMGPDSAHWVDAVMDAVAPQVNAILTTRLRDVLAPAVQEAVHAAVQDAVENCRGPLIEALMVRLRDAVEQELARRALDKRPFRP
jgi:hypothetical protein